ncbi:MAG: helix-turn-helix domain-containing protein [Eubacteriales bacterium]|nr:helix-turn-helix domain-containing protein [Eubacteriales bacterium]
MKTTKESIIQVSLQLFAERGFDAVSTSMIANRLGITKGALYRHFESKQAIFDAIWDRMLALDAERAAEDSVPEKQYSEDAESYRNTKGHNLCEFVNNQFDFWTEHEFARNFRRMITLEQFKSPEKTKLYQDVICAGPVQYTKDIFTELGQQGKLNSAALDMGAEVLAMQLFAPLSLVIQLYDGGMSPVVLKEHLKKITKDFEERWMRDDQ